MTTMTCSKCGIGNLLTSICRDCEHLEKRKDTLSFLKKTLNRKERDWSQQDVRREAKRTDERNDLKQKMRIEKDRITATLQRQEYYQEQPVYREHIRKEAIRAEANRLRARANELELNL